VLTKPLGFGVTTTALKQDKASAEDIQEAVSWMSRLNRTACDLALEFNLRAATDVTGFSLLGHGLEMARASSLGLVIELNRVPLIMGARKYAGLGIFPGGAFDNLSHFGPSVTWQEDISEADQMLLFDPQTSGGLLLGVPQADLEAFLTRAAQLDQPAWVVGRAEEGRGIRVVNP
jgi:selenide,water dikinase